MRSACPTKRKPAMSPGSFFEEGNEADLDAVLKELKLLWKCWRTALDRDPGEPDQGLVSLGRERAELPERAPSIYEAITRHVKEMCDAHGSEVADGL
jgi:hypothetical protein